MSFDLFKVEAQPDCSYDSLCVYDTHDNSPLGCFCGELDSGFTVVFNTSALYMIFTSDDSVAHLGFNIKWEFIGKNLVI